MEEVLDFPDRSVIEAKIQNDCEPFCKEVEAMKTQLKNKISELKELGQSIFDDSIEPIKADTTSQDDTLKVLQGFDEEDYESLLQSNNGILKADITTKVNNLFHKHNVDDFEVRRLLIETIRIVGCGILELLNLNATGHFWKN